jgi:hypothetical protein
MSPVCALEEEEPGTLRQALAETAFKPEIVTLPQGV